MKIYPTKVYLNGTIIDPEAAKVSVFDRGFLFGDGIYEVMVQLNGRFFYEKMHLDRLDEGLRKINIDFDLSILPKEIKSLLTAADLLEKDCLLYIQITRGVAPRKHGFPKNATPTFMMYATPKVLPEINTIHASVVTTEDFRWSRCDIKMTSLLGNVMVNEYAMQHDCYESVLIRKGVVTEASHSNVFFVKDNLVYTHPADVHILNGITRQVVLQLCRKLNIDVREEGIKANDIKTMDEAFLTGTATQIASIKQIDDHFYYENDKIGKVTGLLQRAFLELKSQSV